MNPDTKKIIRAFIIASPLSILAAVMGYQIYDNSRISTKVENATITNTIQECHKNQCSTIVFTDKGTFTLQYGIGSGVDYEQYLMMVSEIKTGQTKTFQTRGREEHMGYIPYFKKNFPNITKIL